MSESPHFGERYPIDSRKGRQAHGAVGTVSRKGGHSVYLVVLLNKAPA